MIVFKGEKENLDRYYKIEYLGYDIGIRSGFNYGDALDGSGR